jgi:phosphatidate cytidylyltransferase
MEIPKLGWRFITAIAIYTALILAVSFSDYPLLILLIVLVSVGQYELWDSLKLINHFTQLIPILLLSITVYGFAYFSQWIIGGAVLLLELPLVGLSSVITVLLYGEKGRWRIPGHAPLSISIYRAAGLSILAFIYIVGLTLFFPALLNLPSGNWKCLLAVSIPVAADTGAYFIGKRFGRNKIVPQISPNKSYQGLLGGLILALAISYLGFQLFFPGTWAEWIPALFAVIGWGLGFSGDLLESAIKRKLNVKDLGDILWGHGGVMDRIDSVIFSAPAMFCLFILLT